MTNNYTFAYFIGAILIFPIWAIIFFSRKDLRKEMISFGLFIGIGAPFIEFGWYLKDYWYPLKYLTTFNFIWQEAIFGFFLGGIISVIYEFFTKGRDRKAPMNIKYIFSSILIVIGSFIIFTNVLHFDSIYSNFIGFLLLIAFIYFSRKDLIKDSLASGFLAAILCILGYSIMLIIYPYLILDWWNFKNISGILVLGIPLEEIIWFSMFGLTFGPLYEFWKTRK